MVNGPLLPGVTPDAAQSLVAVIHLGVVLDTLASTTIPSDVTTATIARTRAIRLTLRFIRPSFVCHTNIYCRHVTGEFLLKHNLEKSTKQIRLSLGRICLSQ
jgi:hypothetical protein